MSKKTNKKEVRKIIDLPAKTLKGVEKLAEESRTKAKPYIEKLVIDHEEEMRNKLIK